MAEYSVWTVWKTFELVFFPVVATSNYSVSKKQHEKQTNLHDVHGACDLNITHVSTEGLLFWNSQ